MTAGLTGVRPADAPAVRSTATLPNHPLPNHPLPTTGFTVDPGGVRALVPEQPGLGGLDLREPSLEGETDSRVLIDTLVARAVNGDGRARDELLALIHPLVLKYCRARLGRQESLMGSADDVAQDVCMAVVSALPNYQLKGLSFRAFVYGIAAHKVTDAFRAIGRNRAEPVADLPDGPVTMDGPENRLLAAEMSARLGALLAHLTPRQREVLVLRLAVGLSAEETAQAVRSTPGAVRVTQHRALGRLRRILLGESAARVLADPAVDDPTPDDVAAHAGPADDSALEAMAAFFNGRVPEQADRRAIPRRRR
jgi:RNA polymerase sigma-70 factor, ECF subfamily